MSCQGSPSSAGEVEAPLAPIQTWPTEETASVSGLYFDLKPLKKSRAVGGERAAVRSEKECAAPNECFGESYPEFAGQMVVAHASAAQGRIDTGAFRCGRSFPWR